jgi:hypothetical protein
MIFYHGTTEKYAEKILKEGLKYDRTRTWKALWPSGRVINDEPGFVYVTSHRPHAIEFAEGKVKYLGIPPGTSFTFCHKQFTKLKTAPVSIEKPVLVVFDLPTHFRYGLESDPHDFFSPSKRYKGILDKNFIVRVEEL